jgi:hypothetical protein
MDEKKNKYSAIESAAYERQKNKLKVNLTDASLFGRGEEAIERNLPDIMPALTDRQKAIARGKNKARNEILGENRDKKYNDYERRLMEDELSKENKARREADNEKRRETRGMKKGGKVMNENMMMKKEGRGMAKANMQKIASKAVKGHEKRMHKMSSGGLSAGHKAADGIAQRGKTRGRIV